MSTSEPVSNTFAPLWFFVKKYYPAGLVLLLLGTMLQCTIERKNSKIAAVQSLQLSKLSQFLESGADLDKKAAQFDDSLASGKSGDEERKAFRESLANHASIVIQLEAEFGQSDTQDYTRRLKQLSEAVETTRGPLNSGPIITQMSSVIVKRRNLAAVAKKSI